MNVLRGSIPAVFGLIFSLSGCGSGNNSTDNIETPQENLPPTFNSAAAIEIDENSEGTVHIFQATDGNNDLLTYSIVQGEDSELFSLSDNGTLTFITPPDFETPADSDTDNIYKINVSVNDGRGLEAVQEFQLSVKDISQIITKLDGPIPGSSFLGVVDKITLTGYLEDLDDGVVSETDLAEVVVNGETQTLYSENGQVRWGTDIPLPNDVNAVEIMTKGKGGWSNIRRVKYYNNSDELFSPFSESVYDSERDRFIIYDIPSKTFFGIDRESGSKNKIYELEESLLFSELAEEFPIHFVTYSGDGKTAYLANNTSEADFIQVDLVEGSGLRRPIILQSLNEIWYRNIVFDEVENRLLVIANGREAGYVVSEISPDDFSYRELGQIQIDQRSDKTYLLNTIKHLRYDSGSDSLYLTSQESLSQPPEIDEIKETLGIIGTGFRIRDIIGKISLNDFQYSEVIPYRDQIPNQGQILTDRSFFLDKNNNNLLLQLDVGGTYHLVAYNLADQAYQELSTNQMPFSDDGTSILSTMIGPDQMMYVLTSTGIIKKYGSSSTDEDVVVSSNTQAKSDDFYYSSIGQYNEKTSEISVSNSKGVFTINPDSGEVLRIVDFNNIESENDDKIFFKTRILHAPDKNKWYFLERSLKPAEFDLERYHTDVIEFDVLTGVHQHLTNPFAGSLHALSDLRFVGHYDGSIYFYNRRILELNEQHLIIYPISRVYRYDIDNKSWSILLEGEMSWFRSFFDLPGGRRLYRGGNNTDGYEIWQEDFLTGEKTKVVDLPSEIRISLNTSTWRHATIDNASNTFYFPAREGILSIDLNTGENKRLIPANNPRTPLYSARALFYDSAKNALFGGDGATNAYYRFNLDSHLLEMIIH